MQTNPKEVSREVLSLTGGAVPLSISYPTFKDKPTYLKQSKWVWAPFENPARADSLKLSHWTLENLVDQEYAFAKFSKKVSVFEYSEEEYQLLESEEWTRQETDYLLKMCADYDLRFIVIADRYSFNEKQRSVEELRDRYYSIAKTLLSSRKENFSQIKEFEYSKQKEVERKQHLEALFSRNAVQAQEEELLFHELKRREQMIKKWTSDRDELLRLFSSFDTLEASRLMSSLEDSMQPKKKKRKEDYEDTPKQRRKFSEMSFQPEEKKVAAGVYMRSQKLATVKQSFQQKLTAMLEELNVPTTKPGMPTLAVAEKYDELRQSICSLLELKRVLDRTEHDLKAAIARRDALEAMDPADRDRKRK